MALTKHTSSVRAEDANLHGSILYFNDRPYVLNAWCLGCRHPGHFQDECRSKKKQQQQRQPKTRAHANAYQNTTSRMEDVKVSEQKHLPLLNAVLGGHSTNEEHLNTQKEKERIRIVEGPAETVEHHSASDAAGSVRAARGKILNHKVQPLPSSKVLVTPPKSSEQLHVGQSMQANHGRGARGRSGGRRGGIRRGGANRGDERGEHIVKLEGNGVPAGPSNEHLQQEHSALGARDRVISSVQLDKGTSEPYTRVRRPSWEFGDDGLPQQAETVAQVAENDQISAAVKMPNSKQDEMGKLIDI